MTVGPKTFNWIIFERTMFPTKGGQNLLGGLLEKETLLFLRRRARIRGLVLGLRLWLVLGLGLDQDKG